MITQDALPESISGVPIGLSMGAKLHKTGVLLRDAVLSLVFDLGIYFDTYSSSGDPMPYQFLAASPNLRIPHGLGWTKVEKEFTDVLKRLKDLGILNDLTVDTLRSTSHISTWTVFIDYDGIRNALSAYYGITPYNIGGILSNYGIVIVAPRMENLFMASSDVFILNAFMCGLGLFAPIQISRHHPEKPASPMINPISFVADALQVAPMVELWTKIFPEFRNGGEAETAD